LAEIAPGRYNLIDGNHRMAKARRDGAPAELLYKRFPTALATLTIVRGAGHNTISESTEYVLLLKGSP